MIFTGIGKMKAGNSRFWDIWHLAWRFPLSVSRTALLFYTPEGKHETFARETTGQKKTL